MNPFLERLFYLIESDVLEEYSKDPYSDKDLIIEQRLEKAANLFYFKFKKLIKDDSFSEYDIIPFEV